MGCKQTTVSYYSCNYNAIFQVSVTKKKKCMLLLLLLASLFGCGFHGALQRTLQRVKLIGGLFEQEAGHKLLQVGGLLILLSVTGE